MPQIAISRSFGGYVACVTACCVLRATMAALTLDYFQCMELAGTITYAVDHDDKAKLLEVIGQLRDTSAKGYEDTIQHSGLSDALLKLANHGDTQIEQAVVNLAGTGWYHGFQTEISAQNSHSRPGPVGPRPPLRAVNARAAAATPRPLQATPRNARLCKCCQCC